jgi:hypothetical protein
MEEPLAGRSYAPVYRVSGRSDVVDYLVDAVRRSGSEPLYVSAPGRAPVFLGVQGPNDERIGVLCYPFRCNPAPIKGRPADEHRLQIRYGGEASWGGDHPLGRDVAGVDTTIVLGVHLEADLLIGLDPARYDPLPMGISIEFKQADVDAATRSGWHVWERENRPGRRRGTERVREGLETLIAFRPERLLAYVGFERNATGLGLDPPLRFRAAEIAATDAPAPGNPSIHELEDEFDLTSADILEIIANRTRLSVAVRGGVAEHHLLRFLRDAPHVVSVEPLDLDGQPDLRVGLVDGRTVLVECKNVSPHRYADGSAKVEVQKTRSQKDDPAGRFYRPEQFDVVAACLFAVTGAWEFRFKATVGMDRHPRHPDRLGVLHRVDDTWSADLRAALEP